MGVRPRSSSCATLPASTSPKPPKSSASQRKPSSATGALRAPGCRRNSRAAVLAEQWKRLRAAYDAVMDAPVPDRPRLLDELSGSDPALASELGKLLAVADDEVFLATPLARLAPPPLSADAELCGRFVLLRRIG